MDYFTGKLRHRNEETETRIEKNNREIWYGLQTSCFSKTEGKFMSLSSA